MTCPELTRAQILAYRRRVGALDGRLPTGAESMRRAAWAGLQDSMPRAALLSLHARVETTPPNALDDPSLVQVWGPRYSVFVVAAVDRAVFTLGRMPETGSKRALAEDLATRLAALLDGAEMPFGQAERALGEPSNRLRYATLTARVLIRWDGARQPMIRLAPPPEMAPAEARLELARRHVHVYGPTTSEAFMRWAGVDRRQGPATWKALEPELAAVRTPIGEAWILAEDEPALRAGPAAAAPARLLPSGDAFYLLQGPERELLVPEPGRREELWTSRVWPGALLVGGDVVGTWRRSQHELSIRTWRRLSRAERDAVEAEASALPLPGVERDITVRWER